MAAACAGIIYFLSYVPYMYLAIKEDIAGDKIPAVYKTVAVSNPFLCLVQVLVNLAWICMLFVILKNKIQSIFLSGHRHNNNNTRICIAHFSTARIRYKFYVMAKNGNH